MLGQGSPGPNRQSRGRSEFGAFGYVVAVVVLLWAVDPVVRASAAEPLVDLRLQIAWGGGAARTWQGTLRLNEGEFLAPQSLGQEVDEVGAFQIVDGAIRFGPRTPSTYSGLEVTVRAPAVAELSLELTPADRATGVKRLSTPIGDLIHKPFQTELDDQKNRLLIARAPGDRLRVRFEHASLVFAPEERFEFHLQPHLLGQEAGATLRCKFQLLKARSDEPLWGEDKEVRAGEGGVFPEVGPISIPLPAAEGVYDAAIAVYPPRRLTAFFDKPLALRRVQLVVLAPQTPRVEAGGWRNIGEIDPIQTAHLPGTADARWTDWLKRTPHIKGLSGFHQGPIGNAKATKHDRNGRSLVQLERDGWLAYPLPIGKVDEPHLLEIQYPADLRQTLGISIVEPNAAGKVAPIGLDSGVDVSEPTTDTQLARHRLVFWPHTKSPLVLLTNRREDGPAMFGKISVLAGPTSLPALPIAVTPGGRELSAYFDKPLFPENFGAIEAIDPASHGTLDDWTTFYNGSRRLVEYLKYAGFNGAVVTVACEGSAIYPSALLQPTPKYDTGLFFASGQDPVRKDVLELLFRMFDREGLKLTPSIQFASPLPELEEERRTRRDPGLEWVNADGQPWRAVHGSRRGLAPYYNPLHPRVQQAMHRVVVELTRRYEHHPSFGGVSLQLGPDSYAQLPGEQWGFDDTTIAALERDLRIMVPGRGPQRFAERAAFLQGDGLPTWLAWRAGRMAALYRDLQETVSQKQPTARLVLSSADLLIDPYLQASLRPALPAQGNLADSLLRIGVDPKLLADNPSIVLPRPHRIAPVASLMSQAVNLNAGASSELDRLFADQARPGVQTYHEVQPLRLPSFDAVSPFGAENTHTSLMTHFTPGGDASRRRFVHALAASDPHVILDGGWMLPLGEEDSLRSVIEVYRQLPAQRFVDVAPAHRESTQPLVVRSTVFGGRSYVYLANDSRWPVAAEVDLALAGAAEIETLGRRASPPPQRTGGSARWSVRLAPFDLQAIAVSDPAARVVDFRVRLENTATAELVQQIQEVRLRANSLRTPQSLSILRNPGFELVEKNQPLPGWVFARGAGVQIAVDANEFAGGKQSLSLRSTGPVTWVRSEPFPVPTSGRLALWVWLKTKDVARQPPLRLAIEAKFDGQTYYRFATVGGDNEATAIQSEWRQYRFQVTDLPPQGLSDLRVGFDLMGAGEVWIDDVQLYDLWFFNHERDELLKRIAVADFQLEQGAVGDCARFLESYWPRLLFQQLPPQAARLAELPAGGPAAATPKAPLPADAESKTWRDRLLPKRLNPF